MDQYGFVPPTQLPEYKSLLTITKEGSRYVAKPLLKGDEA
jgi:hypothetical protein